MKYIHKHKCRYMTHGEKVFYYMFCVTKRIPTAPPVLCVLQVNLSIVGLMLPITHVETQCSFTTGYMNNYHFLLMNRWMPSTYNMIQK